MTTFKTLAAWVDDVEKLNKKAAYRALNKSASKTKTQFSKEIRAETGLKAKDVNRRLYQRKAYIESIEAYVSLGTKVGIPLRLFKPKEKIVKVGRGKKAKRYKGVTVKIPSVGGRFTVPGGFLITNAKGKSLASALVVQRKGAARNPLTEVRFNITEAAEKKQGTLVKFMRDDFKNQFRAQLKALR